VPKIEQAIKDAIHRGARRQIRLLATPLRREVRRLRRAVAQFRRDLGPLREVARRWQGTQGERAWTSPVTEEEAKAARLSPRLIRALRTRLGVSQAKLARLVGVSAVAVAQWETGRAVPSGKNRPTVVALRRLGRRDVKRLLAEMPTPAIRPVRRRVQRKARARKRARRPRRTR